MRIEGNTNNLDGLAEHGVRGFFGMIRSLGPLIALTVFLPLFGIMCGGVGAVGVGGLVAVLGGEFEDVVLGTIVGGSGGALLGALFAVHEAKKTKL